nr:helix-turn-helix domain-containing protein [Brevundimonas diminuta]
MNIPADTLQGAMEGGGPELANDLAMASHEPILSTKRAYDKHILSLDAADQRRQVPHMKIGDRIARARQAKGMSQKALAVAVGTAQTTISSWERNRTEPTRADVERVALALQMKPSELETSGADADHRQVPVVGYVAAGSAAVLYSEGQGNLDYVPAPDNAGPRTVAAEIRGDSLGPVLDNWLVFYEDVRSPVTPDMFNSLCVVGLADGRVLVKRLRPAANGLFHLDSNSNEPTLTDQVVEWAALVTNMRPR